MLNKVKNLASSKEKLVKYAVIQVSISKNIDNEISNINNIYCDKNNIFDSEDLADKFCDHANKREKLDYQWLVQEIILDK
mgnify:FL=1|tara:strand:+ start:998 stop:1237 length:240 start_codon:yes stop_codon:yes gene_type:complete